MRRAPFHWQPLGAKDMHVELVEVASTAVDKVDGTSDLSPDLVEVRSLDDVVLGYIYHLRKGRAKWLYRLASDLALKRRGSNLESLEHAVSQLLYALRERGQSDA